MLVTHSRTNISKKSPILWFILKIYNDIKSGLLKIVKTLEASLVDQQLIQSEMERLAKAIPEKPIRKSQLEPTVIPTTVVNSSESESSIPVNIIENTKLEVVQP